MEYYINRYKKFIEEGLFFEAHEALEEFWFPKRREKSPKVLIVKGFINAAVALELKKRGRLEASKRVWQTYKKLSKKLDKYPNRELLELKLFIEKFAI